MVDEAQRRVKVVSLRVGYRSATLEEFIDRHAMDVGRNGVYIKTAQPFPIGTLLRLQIHIASGQVVMTAIGRVAWTRDAMGENRTRPAGMGVRFVETDEASKKLIDGLSSTRADAGLAYEEGFRSGTSSAPPAQPTPMFPPADGQPLGQDEPTLMTRMEDIIDEATAPHGLLKQTLMGIGALPPAPGAREPSQPDEPTLIKKVPELLEESLREPAPSMVDFTSPVLVDDVRLDAPRPAAEPSAPSSTSRRATPGIREIVAALAILTVAFTITADRARRRPKAAEQRPNVATMAAATEATPATPVSAPPETPLQQLPTPISEPAATSEAMTPDASPPVAARAAAPPAPTRASVVHKKLPVETTTASALSKPKWLLKPGKVDNPY
jgi:uncharacterized protein (TIGR02266 family)